VKHATLADDRNANANRLTGPHWHDLYTVPELCLALDYQAAHLTKMGHDLLAQELLVVKEAIFDLSHKLNVAREGLAEAERIVRELTRGKVDPDSYDHHEDEDLFEETP